MTESIGLAVCSEVPVVVLDVMRCGPSTGIATKSEQSDLNIAFNGLHGDAPHLVLAPTSVSGLCISRPNGRYIWPNLCKPPAIVLSDQSLGQTRAIVNRPADIAFMARRQVPEQFEEDYYRYAVGDSGVPPCQFRARRVASTPLTDWNITRRAHHRACRKITLHSLKNVNARSTAFDYGEHWADLEGSGETAVITWGSTTGPVREALSRLRKQGEDVRLIAMRLLAPERPLEMAAALKGVKRLLVVEQSHSRQFHRYLRAAYDLPG